MSKGDMTHENTLLRRERMRRNWRQQDLADQLGTTVVTIKRWEKGTQQPGAYFHARLCALFGKSAEELGLISVSHPGAHSLAENGNVWSVPFARNAFFTGRDLFLKQLHSVLTRVPTMAALTQSYALNGLGGIGKTQLAIEYAYHYRSEYRAVLWIEAETSASLTSSFVRLAEVLMLPEQAEEDQSKIVAAVLHWLNRHERWLLIFDNVESLSLIKPFLPANDQGALLLTTRLQTLGTLAQRIELPPMNMQEGCTFLLARINNRFHQGKAHAIIDPQEKTIAEAIVSEMGGLPLALEQAGAYIASTQCSLMDYLHLFRHRQYHLLDAHELSNDHPLSVNRTFSLTFERVEQRHPLAADLLTACAFLAPDAIPEMFFRAEALWPGKASNVLETDALVLPEAIKVLLSYSLLQRNPVTRTITVHRLVQVVLRGRLTEVEQRSKGRAVVKAMTQLFPDDELQEGYLALGEQLITHAQACLSLCDQWDGNEELAIPLMTHVAGYLFQRVRYAEAEPLFEQAIHRGERALGTDHPLVAGALHGLANLYNRQGKYAEALPLLERALNIREQVSGTQHALTAASLDTLGYCYHQQGKYELSEPLLLRALRIRKQIFAPKHPHIAFSLMNLGSLYFEQRKYEQAEPYYQHALAIWEQTLGSKHPQVASALNNLGAIFYERGEHGQAELHFQRALRLWEQTLGPEHPDVAFPLNGLGELYDEQGKYKQAEACYRRALHIWEQAWGSEHPHIGFPLNNLGEIHRYQGEYEQAEACYQRALYIWEKALGRDHPNVALPLNNLGEVYRQQEKYEQAEACYQRALHIWGPEHLDAAFPLNGLATILREQQKYEQAESLYQRALLLRQQNLNSVHPEIAETLHDLARLYALQRRMVESLSLYQQALAMREQIHGPQHPRTKETYSDLALLLQEMSWTGEAIPAEAFALVQESVLLCACGCGRLIDRRKSRGELKRFFSEACRQRFHRNVKSKDARGATP